MDTKSKLGVLCEVGKEEMKKLVTGRTINEVVSELNKSGIVCTYNNVYDRICKLGLKDSYKKDLKGKQNPSYDNGAKKIIVKKRPGSGKHSRVRVNVSKSALQACARRGLKDIEIAKELSISTTTVSRRMREFGLRKSQKRAISKLGKEPVNSMTTNDADRLSMLVAGEPKLMGFLPKDGKIVVMLRTGAVDVGFSFSGDYELVSGEDIRSYREDIAREFDEARKKMELAGNILKSRGVK